MVDTNTAMANIDTPVPYINPVELMSRLEPEQQIQLRKIEQKIYLEDYRRQSALTVENQRFEHSMMLANQEHQNELVQKQYQADRDDQREARKSLDAEILVNKNHENNLERIQVELQNHKDLALFNTGLSVIPKLMEEYSKVRTSTFARQQNSSEVLDDVFKKLAEDVTKEKLAKKQHIRDLDKMRLESSLKQSEQYFQSICLRLSKLLGDSQEEKVKQELDQLEAMWDEMDAVRD